MRPVGRAMRQAARSTRISRSRSTARSTANPDLYGHGTHVASVAAGQADPGRTGRRRARPGRNPRRYPRARRQRHRPDWATSSPASTGSSPTASLQHPGPQPEPRHAHRRLVPRRSALPSPSRAAILPGHRGGRRGRQLRPDRGRRRNSGRHGLARERAQRHHRRAPPTTMTRCRARTRRSTSSARAVRRAAAGSTPPAFATMTTCSSPTWSRPATRSSGHWRAAATRRTCSIGENPQLEIERVQRRQQRPPDAAFRHVHRGTCGGGRRGRDAAGQPRPDAGTRASPSCNTPPSPCRTRRSCSRVRACSTSTARSASRSRCVRISRPPWPRAPSSRATACWRPVGRSLEPVLDRRRDQRRGAASSRRAAATWSAAPRCSRNTSRSTTRGSCGRAGSWSKVSPGLLARQHRPAAVFRAALCRQDDAPDAWRAWALDRVAARAQG